MANALAERGPANTQTVAAVVVTYNRKALLKRCLDAIFAQSRRVDRLFVIDNCSTDGTPDFLEKEGFLQEPVVEYVRLPENMGGAGGFHEGMKLAYEQGYDWMWVTDDDGVPMPDALSRLVESPCGAQLRGCTVLREDNPSGEELACGITTAQGVARGVGDLERLSDRDRAVDVLCLPFNGVLISREVVLRTGLPRREFFLWGDDTEYFLRARRAGFRAVAILDARFLHPPERMMARRVRIGPLSFGLQYSDDPFRFYLLVRNYTFISFRYDGLLSKRFLKLAAYPFLFPSRAGLILRAWYEGLTGRMAIARSKGR